MCVCVCVCVIDALIGNETQEPFHEETTVLFFPPLLPLDLRLSLFLLLSLSAGLQIHTN